MKALERVEQRPTDGGGVTGTESTDELHFMSVDTLIFVETLREGEQDHQRSILPQKHWG